MSRNRSARALMILSAALVLVVAACGDDDGGGSRTAGTAELRVLAGTVEVQAPGSGFSGGVDGQVLNEGDTVRTGSDGRAAIEYFDGSVTRLDFLTTFTIAEMGILDTGSTVIEGSQTSGNTYTRVVSLTDSQSRFEVVTPTATASVQGTVYAVILNPDGSTSVMVTEGAVNVLGGDATTSVPAGYIVTVFTDGSISDPEPIPADLLDSDWIAYNQCDLDQERDCDVAPEPAPLASIEVTPESAEVDPGEAQAFTAEGFDATGASLGSVEATYEITDGVCDGASCASETPGDHTVTASYGGFTDTATLTVRPVPASGVEVILDWDGPVDLDLWVTDPNGELVRYDSNSSSGGTLGVDAHKDCEAGSPQPPEIISWEPGTAPAGVYGVTVDYWAPCDGVAAQFRLTVKVNGETVLYLAGILSNPESSYLTSFTVGGGA